MRPKSLVTTVPAARPDDAARHFAALFEFETDCWDVHYTMTNRVADFVLLDVRSKDLFEAGHVPGAIHFPHAKLAEASLAAYPQTALFVVYCSGPHCNGAARAAVKLAKLGRPVKLMVGGVTGWIDEGFNLVGIDEETRAV